MTPDVLQYMQVWDLKLVSISFNYILEYFILVCFSQNEIMGNIDYYRIEQNKVIKFVWNYAVICV